MSHQIGNRASNRAKWRKWNNIIHRDLGYLCVGMTLIFVISGIAVNHIQDWNPNYKIEKIRSNIGPVLDQGRSVNNDEIVSILMKIGVDSGFKKKFQPNPNSIKIFQENNTIDIDLITGSVSQEKVRKRPFFFQMNFLHLNHAKKMWTWFADIYAVALGILAITGLFVLRGKKGIKGRGAWLSAIGVVIPILFLLAYG